MNKQGGRIAPSDRLRFAQQLFDRHAEEIYRYVLAWTGEQASAVELTTMVLRTAAARMEEIVDGAGAADLEIRLVALARAAVTKWRAGGRAERGAAMVVPEESLPLLEGLGELDDHQREVLILCELLGYGPERAARLLACDQSVVQELRREAAESLWRVLNDVPAEQAVSTWDRLTVGAALRHAARQWLSPAGDSVLAYLGEQVLGEAPVGVPVRPPASGATAGTANAPAAGAAGPRPSVQAKGPTLGGDARPGRQGHAKVPAAGPPQAAATASGAAAARAPKAPAPRAPTSPVPTSPVPPPPVPSAPISGAAAAKAAAKLVGPAAIAAAATAARAWPQIRRKGPATPVPDHTPAPTPAKTPGPSRAAAPPGTKGPTGTPGSTKAAVERSGELGVRPDRRRPNVRTVQGGKDQERRKGGVTALALLLLRGRWAAWGIAALGAAGLGMIAVLTVGGPVSGSSQCEVGLPCLVSTTVAGASADGGAIEPVPTDASGNSLPTTTGGLGVIGPGHGFPMVTATSSTTTTTGPDGLPPTTARGPGTTASPSRTTTPGPTTPPTTPPTTAPPITPTTAPPTTPTTAPPTTGP
jgi:DNA-directed RNA polymerase specialized sigma24 family protein